MTSIDHVTLEVADTKAAQKFYADAFGIGDRVQVTAGDSASSGFRGYTLSVVVAQPSTAQSFFDSAVAAGATVLKPFASSLWGVGGLVQAPDGAIWNIATASKKETGAPARQIDNVVLLIGAEDVGASKKFYVERGLTVNKSLGGYVDFDLGSSPVGLGLYKRKALAKSAAVSPEGSGSHRIQVASDAGAFTDPDGFSWVASARG
jgi:uncharacterized glyoxalase superfamily protein PhnB